jgi:hypothetical protein
MTWKSLPEVEATVAESDRESIGRAYALSRFLLGAVPVSGYATDPRWAELVAPSAHGHSLIALEEELATTFSTEDLCLALFMHLYHLDLLIDVERTDLHGIQRLISSEITAGKLLLPHRFGRQIYDKFNDDVANSRTNHLEARDVLNLLQDTPIGVYQVGNYLSGPLGLLESKEARFAPPVAEVPLWHCSDTGCNALHTVTLLHPDTQVSEAYDVLDTLANGEWGPPSEWNGVLRELHRGDLWDNGRPYYDLIAVIGDCIVGQDRSNLLSFVLRSPTGKWLREVLAMPPRRKNASEGSAEAVVGRLSESEQMQLLLMLSDSDLVSLIDRAVANDHIEIPPNELRSPRMTPLRISRLDTGTEISSLGSRSAPDSPLITLTSVVWAAYEEYASLQELGWKLNRRADVPEQSDVFHYVKKVSPSDAIRDLILSSMPVTQAVARKFDIVLGTDENTTQMTERMLWKLGFNRSRYSPQYERMRTRIEQFNETLLRVGTVRSEADREAIRSVGVNLFVSVEHVLEEMVAYNIWVLSSDHFAVSRFQYDHREALQVVAVVLGEQIARGENVFVWSVEGGNSLGTLGVYLEESVAYMRGLLIRSTDEVLRREEDLPHFAREPYRVFPFWHTEFWADADKSRLEIHFGRYEAIARLFAQSNFASIRNGLDHNRGAGDFPAVDTMLACAARLREALSLADMHRFIPKTYWLHTSRRDRYGNVDYELLDYASNPVALTGPSPARGLRSFTYDEPVVIAPGDLLAIANTVLTFSITEGSAYSEYWTGYPRRRRLPPESTRAQEQLPADNHSAQSGSEDDAGGEVTDA